MNSFVARQPILTRSKKLFGYELLFRTGMDNTFPDIDGSFATSSLLSSSFFSVGIDKISGGRKSFINFTEDLLLKGTPSMFPKEKIMVEILEDVKPTNEIIDACKSLKRLGYTIALDDFEYSKQYDELLPLANIVKIDFLNSSPEEIQKIIDVVKGTPTRLLAEKIETYDEYNYAKKLGFSFFQGYFFSKPEIIKNRDISPGKLTVLQLIAELNKTEFNVDLLEKLINQDVAITYKLLKYLNSAYFSRLSPLKSIRQAIAFLGENGVRLFVSLIATSQLAEDKPDELVKLSIIRSRFLENVGKRVNDDSSELFLLGLFSLIDAMLDNPMDFLIKQLPLSDRVSIALVHKTGPCAIYLNMVESYESGNWDQFQPIAKALNLREEEVTKYYLDAIAMAESF